MTNKDEIKEKMDEIFTGSEKPVGILIQHSPDPDALGAALGFSVLLKHVYNIDSKIYHFGEISHAQNKTLKNILHIALEDGEDFDPDKVSATVVLDTDLEATGFKSENLNSVDVRIDHHSMDRDSLPKLNDVRNVGATCSIIWEYLNVFNFPLQSHDEVATALVLGITTDTLNFTSPNVTDLDMEAYRSLLPYIDKAALARINKFPLPKQVFEAEVIAYEKKDIKGTVLTTFIGQIAAGDRDIISIISDRFFRMEGINTVVVMAVVGSDLHASIRSDDSRIDVGEFCRKVFGKNYSGGKEGSGGARLPLGKAFNMVRNEEIRSQLMNEVVRSIKTTILEIHGTQE